MAYSACQKFRWEGVENCNSPGNSEQSSIGRSTSFDSSQSGKYKSPSFQTWDHYQIPRAIRVWDHSDRCKYLEEIHKWRG